MITVALLLVFGLQLRDSQATARQRVVDRFHDRAQVISALTQALVSSATGNAETARRYGGATVSDQAMDQAAAEGHLVYAALLDDHGSVIASSRGLTPATRTQMSSDATVRSVLGGAPVGLSDVLPGGPRGTGLIALAVSLNTPAGRRVLVSGAPTSALSSFLGTYLRRVPTRDGTAYVLDSRGAVVGARDPRAAVGRPATQAGLLDALRRATGGPYGRDGYFVAVPIPSSTWRVVLTSQEGALFQSVNGSRKWLPWGIFIALGVVALAFLFVLRRLLHSAAALAGANRRLEGTNARLESTNALLRHAAELARSNAELEQFASIASHDLQEPLRKVQTFAAQLMARERERLSEEGQDFLGRMSDASGRMRALIDDLLVFSRVSTQARPFVAVDLDDVVAQVLGDLEVSIEEAQADVTVEDLPTIAADPVQMRQLMQNLLGNALKFRREGVRPEVRVHAHVIDEIAEVTVQDNGIGFDDKYATRIFRAFERLHGSGAYAGTGIGLALCRKIVERHHGTITASGGLGDGATFVVRLPLEQPAEGAPPPSLFPEVLDEVSETHV